MAAETKKRKGHNKDAKAIGSIEELKRGDYVVHDAHGIGVFDGINRITNDGITKDYIRIKYAKSDVLYVPVNQLDLVSKYIGAATENGSIKLHRLGGAEWQKTRKRVKAAVRDMAKQLTALYAKRMAAKGYAFSEDTDLQNNFERRFEYDETDDQLRCINEIKKDMERSVPMDRLLCGDVGFGKTEVALRAAFKCISEGKQCAVLVPTTILAMQHYNTIVRRFGEMPVTVAMLSRFVTKKRQEKIISDLKTGRLDLVVGTHRLISKDIAFKDIGLVIIDEEQRFGVAQKERLKELYPHVDILTLSATPIPRTLNMAMSGLRDMSSIDEAPGDRHPVQTYVLEQNMGVIIDAINREIRRGGQVYYLHNRVDTITHCAARLKARLPENVNIGIAHGKMSEDELSDIWKKLLEHEIDILVCTTIIETGVDAL
ncbi:MAG: DEAD/DEAH box helicase [Clostridia bacterium]|nr:DEAD/DEAH box helicase [Clostridia bacterium]